METETAQADRSRLLNRQKKDRTELEKDVKKKKGAMKTAAQKTLDDLMETQAAELASFDARTAKEVPVIEEAPKKEEQQPVADPSAPMDVEWGDLSKKELQEECVRRGLSRGGRREELVTRLIGWNAEMKHIGYVPCAPMKKDDSDSDENDSDNDSVSGSSDSSSDMDDTQKLEAEKQYKREVIVRKAIIHLFEAKFHDGFPLEDLAANLEKIKVMNFKVESLGYTTLHEFARKQPREAIFYDKGIKWLKPVHLRSEKRGGHNNRS